MSLFPSSTTHSDECFNTLPAAVWPRTAYRARGGEVVIGGVSLVDVAQTYGTPTFVVDEKDFRSRCRDMAEAFGGADRVHYAAKAFLTTTIARWVAEEGLCLDVASEGELACALAAGFPPQRITAHGNNKSDHFVAEIIDNDVAHVVVDSLMELERLSSYAVATGKEQKILLRVTPGIEAHTHEFIATAHEDQKFGFSLASGAAYKAVCAAVVTPGVRVVGLHCHVGSQVFDAEGFSLAADRLLGLWAQVSSTLPADVMNYMSILDLGGGYGIAYTAHQEPLDVRSVARDLRARVDSYALEHGVRSPHLMVEPGRAIAGPSTVTVYSVGTIKDVEVGSALRGGVRRYISVDGGMSDNIRPALYGAEYDARVLNREVADGVGIHPEAMDDPSISSALSPLRATRVVGSHCESGDILISDAYWPEDIQVGDLLGVPATGAYCYMMSSRYNMFLRPAVVSVCDGRMSCMVRRETLEDILALEPPISEE